MPRGNEDTAVVCAPETVGLAEAARQLAVPWARAWNWMLAGKLEGEKDASGRWRIRTESIARVERERSRELARSA